MKAEEAKKPGGIRSAAVMKKLLAEHFQGLDRASKDPALKVAWCTSVGPAELLRAFGYDVYFPENHAAIMGANRTAMDYIPAANAEGYSPDICSYLTSDVGARLKGLTPLTKAYGLEAVPRPEVLVYNTSQCRDVQEWFRWWGKELDRPVLGITPPRSVGPLTDGMISDVETQMRAVSSSLEGLSGSKLDPEKLKETLALSLEATLLWGEVLDSAMKKPAPLSFFDSAIHMGPIVVLRGTRQAVEYYRLLKAEMDERVRDGVAAVEGEEHRIYWDGMPVWGKLRSMSELFARLKTCVAASTYCNSWFFPSFDPSDPFRSMAKAYTEIFIVRDEAFKEAYISKKVRDFSLSGVLFHDAKTCPSNSNTRYGMPRRLKERLGVNTLVIHGDLNDLRLFSEEQATTSIEAFVEAL